VPLTGTFKGSTQSPVVGCRLLIRSLAIDREIRFLVDTRAQVTMISSADTERMAIDVSRLDRGPTMDGVGGGLPTHRVSAMLVFRETPRRLYMYRLSIVIAAPGAMSRDLPSVLGRDILNRWHMTYRPMERRLEFDVVSSDGTLDLDGGRASGRGLRNAQPQ
jgi:hypothetical protein